MTLSRLAIHRVSFAAEKPESGLLARWSLRRTNDASTHLLSESEGEEEALL